MKCHIHTYRDVNQLKFFLSTSEIQSEARKAKSILVQIYSAQNNETLLKKIIDTIQARLPDSVIAGSTTVGEIADGCLQLGTIMISVTLFQKTQLHAVMKSCSQSNEKRAGKALMREIRKSGSNIAGVLLLATPLNINLANVVNGMSQSEVEFPVFGGGAGVYDSAAKRTLIFIGDRFSCCGIIAIVFLSDDLHIYANSQLGWQPLTKEMSITESDGLRVKTVDHFRAFDLYHRYLNIKPDHDFFYNVLEFPFLLERDGYTVARVPFFVDENGSIEFIADVLEGEKFKIGYGDPERIVQNSKQIQKEMLEFDPDAIFIFACICRRFLMQDDVNLEIKPFKSIAATSGFFTYGEFFHHKNKIQLLNSTIVVVGMREGERTAETNRVHTEMLYPDSQAAVADPFSEKHNQIVSRLLHFISVLSSELEYANHELTYLSEVDRLTQLFNRMKLEKVLESELKKSEALHTIFSVILMDVDKFKDVNDTQGHITGDEVLKELALILKMNARKNDTTGRWGGEEFLLILPQTNREQACSVAERMRRDIESHAFPDEKPLTCSFGVTAYHSGDTQDLIISRADKALYHAKESGRNRVEYLK